MKLFIVKTNLNETLAICKTREAAERSADYFKSVLGCKLANSRGVIIIEQNN